MISLAEFPSRFAPAYKPVQWGFTSTRSPNTTPGEFNLPIFAIGAADQAAVDALPGLALGDIYVILANPAPNLFQVGGQVALSSTTGGSYDGTFRIDKVISDAVFVIATDILASSFGGFATKVYSNLRLNIYVQMDTQTEPQRYTIDADPDGVFRVDMRRQAQREFRDIFQLAATVANPGAQNAATRITNGYSITATESWTEYANGVGVQFENLKDIYRLPGRFMVVNSVQPYHHTDEWTDTVDLEWDEDLAKYIANNGTIQTTILGQPVDLRARMLTYWPAYDGTDATMQKVRPGDTHYLGFLTDASGTVYTRFRYFDSTGTLIGLTAPPNTWGDGSSLVACGPANIGQAMPTNTAYYLVDMVRLTGFVPVTLPYAFKIDRACHKAPRRLFALNKFGAIDAFTFEGYEARTNNNTREVVQRPVFPARLPSERFGWNTRTWRNTPARTYAISSQTHPKEVLRWVADEILESPDVRTVIHTQASGLDRYWTPVILLNGQDPMGWKHGRLRIEYAFGIDNQVQTR